MKDFCKSEAFLGTLFSIIISVIIFFAVLWATSEEHWVAGEHDTYDTYCKSMLQEKE